MQFRRNRKEDNGKAGTSVAAAAANAADSAEPSVKATKGEADPDSAQDSAQDGKPVKSKSSRGITGKDIAKFSVLIAIIAAGIVLTIALWPYIMQLTTQEGIDQLTQTVRDSGPLAVLVLLALQLVQVIVAFIPGEIVQIVAGILYGPLWGTVIILGGAFVSTIVIYYMVQKLGTPFVSKMVNAQTQEKLDFITKTKRIDAIVLIVFLIPGLPKDALTYLIALTDVKPSRFFILSTVGRAPGVIASSFAGSSIAEGNWVMLLVIAAIVAAVLVVSFLKRDKVMGKFNDYADETASETENTCDKADGSAAGD